MTSLPYVVTEIAVVSSAWLVGADRDPPSLELELSDGSFLKLSWDIDYSCPIVWSASDKSSDYESVAAASTVLGDAIVSFLDEAEAAVRAHASNDRAEWEADANNYSDGRNS